MSDAPERLVRRFDDYQQARWWLAHPLAVVRKYADDRGSALAGLVSFQVFLGMLPLLVVALTVLGRILEVREAARQAVLDSTIAQFPVIGTRLERNVEAVRPDSIWVVASLFGLLWTATGIYHGMQLALNQVWNVQGVDRQGFVSRHVRAVVLFFLVLAAAIGTAFVRGRMLVTFGSAIVMEVLTAAAGVAVAAVLLLAVFRLVVSPSVPWICLVPAALFSGLLWELLQRIGTWFVVDRLARAEDLYGSIGFVVVTLFWINLLARSAIFANEWAVVSWRRLWPRRIAQPPLTEADREVLEGLIRNERRRPEAHITVRFDSDQDGAGQRRSTAGDEAPDEPDLPR